MLHFEKILSLGLMASAMLTLAAGNPEPRLSIVAGANWEMPHHASNFTGDQGWRGGLAYASSLPIGEMNLPLEMGLVLRTASLRSTDYYSRNVFTDLQAPFIFHGPLFGLPRLEILGLWIPSYTLSLESIGEHDEKIVYTNALRTRFNMGFGAGLQFAAFYGIRLRSYWVANIFSAFPASQLTFSDLGAELTFPLLFKKGEP